MRGLSAFILLISVAASSAAYLEGEREKERVIAAYWREKLPITPIPQSVLELIYGDDDDVNVRTVEPKSGAASLIRSMQELEGVHVKTQKTHEAHLSRGAPDGLPYAEDEIFNYHGYGNLFLLEKDLQCGTKISQNFSNKQKTHVLPRALADEIPFSSYKLPLALKELNIAPDSVMALAMKKTIEACERPAVKGETKFCPTSVESMIDFTTSKLGSNRLILLATSVPKTSKAVKQEYTVVGVKYESEAEIPPYVCHLVRYAYAVYYCHVLQGTKAVRVWVKGEDGKEAEAAAICHTDTSAWSPSHVALQRLNVKPGGASVCHFIIENHLVWVRRN